jgi:hypothetical protein
MLVPYPPCWHIPRLLQRFEEHEEAGLVGGAVGITAFIIPRKNTYVGDIEIIFCLISHLRMMVVEIDNVYHSMGTDMNKHNHQVDVEYIVHHLHILLHFVNNQALNKGKYIYIFINQNISFIYDTYIFHIDHLNNQVDRNNENLVE